LPAPHVSHVASLGAVALLLSACGTVSRTRALPPYEPPLAKTGFQHVRTTAYTHTESDHREFSNRNALGGELHAAGPPIHRAEYTPRAIAVSDTDDVGIRRVSASGAELQPFSLDEPRTTRITVTTRTVRTKRGVKRAVAVSRAPRIGTAAADWSRWPVGTTFRLLSTGQIYRVEDYGWALSGRNARDMNNWGARVEPIQILQWGNPDESLRLLEPHQGYPHIKRMVLELQGREEEAAALQ
jgi:hypothetical protein